MARHSARKISEHAAVLQRGSEKDQHIDLRSAPQRMVIWSVRGLSNSYASIVPHLAEVVEKVL